MSVKIITCPWCGAEARITYEEDRVYQMKCYACHNSMLHEDRSFDRAVEFFEHHAKILQAEQAGRLVVLPCKVGDTVYDTILGEIREKKVLSVTFLQSISAKHMSINVSNQRGAITTVEMWMLGKTVFLTRDEAEAALKGGCNE